MSVRAALILAGLAFASTPAWGADGVPVQPSPAVAVPAPVATTGTRPAAAIVPAAAPASTPAAVDMSALRYYASRNETARVEAEIRRLRSLYPGWQPPADPSALADEDEGGGTSPDQPLWDLFGADRLDELRAEIARRQAADASFVPAPDLIAKLALKDARAAIVQASDRGDSEAVVALLDKSPGLVLADDLDLAWRAADAQARTGNPAKALEIDRTILGVVQDPEVRLATVRKAMATLGPDEMRALLALGKTGADGRSEFDPVAVDLARQRISRILSGDAADEIVPADVERLAAIARAPGAKTDDAALLGWLQSRRRDWPAAYQWFRIALEATPDPAKATATDAKLAEGAVLALKEMGRSPEAEEIAYRWRERDPALTLLYMGFVEPDLTRPMPVALDQDRLKRFSEVVKAQQAGNGAQALGWYAYNVGQVAPARAWFEKAMAWQPRDTTALGLALSMQRLGATDELAAFLEKNLALFPSLAPVAQSIARPQARPAGGGTGVGGEGGAMAAAFRRKDYGGCVAMAERREGSGRAASAVSLQKGWCLMALNRPLEAARAFAAASGSGGSSSDASYGEALAYLRSGETAKAAMAANGAPLTQQRRNEIGVAILAQQAAAAFDREAWRTTLDALNRRRTFVAEPRDLSMLRGWSLYHLGRKDEAILVFGALDRQLSTHDSQAGLAAATEPRH